MTPARRQAGTRRCSICGINYPPDITQFNLCRSCGENTSLITNDEPHENWEELVELRLASKPVWEDQTPRWRFEQLLRAGYLYEDARDLAERKDIDLHFAIDLLARGCPPHTAWEILK